MKYILLVHHNEETFNQRSQAERQRLLQESVALANELHREGQYLSAAPLHPSDQTRCVKVREGKALVTDGPFAETREQLGGYFLVEAAVLKKQLRSRRGFPALASAPSRFER